MLSRLARWCFTHHWLTVIIWLVALGGGTFVANGPLGGSAFETRFSIPDSQSLRALDLLVDAYPDADPVTDAQIVFSSPTGFEDSTTQIAITNFLSEVRSSIDGLSVSNPFEDSTLIS